MIQILKNLCLIKVQLFLTELIYEKFELIIRFYNKYAYLFVLLLLAFFSDNLLILVETTELLSFYLSWLGLDVLATCWRTYL